MNSNRNKEGSRDGRKSKNYIDDPKAVLAKNVDLVGKISGFADGKVWVTVEGLCDLACQVPHPGVISADMTNDRSLRVNMPKI